ncbi:MAG: hypothetical protein LBH01_04405 [Verrucomicrobiales bacterium]|jgi:cellobiose phosphorylase|nr:hypothetical protein [Verrucomicrobiales bacterium]
MSNTHGHFSQDGKEYIITNPQTPRPWHNYLVNDVYQVNLTQLGTGASFYQPRSEGLRTNVTEDKDGNGGPRYVYLRDEDSGDYWSLTGAPSFPKMQDWRCRVGLGYQINESKFHDIAASWRVFVPQTQDPCEIWTLTITNRSQRPRKISVFPYLEMHLTGGSTLMDFIAVLGGRYDAELGCVFGINSCVKFPDTFKALLASDAPVVSATVSRDEFLGPYRDYHRPLAVERGDVHNPVAGTEWLGASLKHSFQLAPGESVSFNCLVAVISNTDEAKDLIPRYLDKGAPEQHFQTLKANSEQICQRSQIKTGDEQFDRWMNVWLKHQLAFVARWGRVIGRGFRDILQDSFGHRLTDPAKARSCILETFSKQYPSGKCIRAWRLPHGILDIQDYADSPSWMIMALSMYLAETADYSILEEQVTFLDPQNPAGPPAGSATAWEHVVLAQRHLLGDLGAHGLSKIHYGDWCDTMNGVGAKGRGESVMLSMQVKWGCDLLSSLAARLGGQALADEMATEAIKLNNAIESQAWDGDWYLRAFDDDGIPVGTHNPPPSDNGEGKIFMNPQSWAVISGVAKGERLDSALQHANSQLNTGYGMILNYPPYTALRPRIGQMTAMSPGFYENGSVYVHGNCFWIHALAVAGRGQQAWEALRNILPDTANKPNGDTEPFVIPNYYIGPNVDRRKQRNLFLSGWRTGSAAWVYMTCLEWILGVRAEYDGLRIDPRLPDGWNKVSVTRHFRGDIYDITISGGPGKVAEISVDGKVVAGTLITPFGDGKTHTVNVTLK